jgi:hypothetical protein
MAKKKTAPKKSTKKTASKKVAKRKSKASVAAKRSAPLLKKVAKVAAPMSGTAAGRKTGSTKAPAAKGKSAKGNKLAAKAKPGPKRSLPDAGVEVSRGSQDVDTVRLKPKSRVARAGTGSGDLQGISIVEDVDSESADELLEEGQAFEAGIVSGVERAGTEESEVITHEVLQDDVPGEYDDDRP